MGLKEYRRKRKFVKTPEPKVTKKTGKPGFGFVVQKHYASHLHYDFRMENEGVLKSWAVPKGFPVDPKDKRLAIQVEDHPLEYKNFQGTIPEGSYGAGEVIIWDKGRYSLDNGENRKEKESEKHMAQSLEKGHLNFTLSGEKLKGRFSLIRLRNKENQWLLIKRGDFSVGKKATRSFSGALKAPLPLSVKPMLATLVNEPFDREEWIFEVKWDGYRSLAQIKNGKVRLYSRNDKTQNEKFPQVADDLRKLPFDALFDGEIVAVDKEGRPNFQMLQNYMRSGEEKIIYYVFDVLYAKEFDLRPLPLRQRKEILRAILPVSETVRLSDYIEKKGKTFYKASERNGLEGIMAKDLSSPYRSGIRSRDWLKVKIQKRQEAVICGFTQPRASRKYFGALILGVYSEGGLSYAGHVGSGFDERSLKFIYQKLLPLVTDKCPFAPEPKTNMPVRWVKPELLCEVKFAEWTNEGIMRQPVFLGLREDKSAKEVIREQPGPALTKKTKIKTKANLTHLDKVFWPKEGFTKKDVIEYYESIWKWIKPYLLNRPQSLNRHPDGIDGENFFQKDIRHPVPDYVKTEKIFSESENRELNYLVCQNKNTLLYVANLGCIEINTFSSVIQHLENPDYLILDFDPEEVAFSKVIEIVLAARRVLDEIKLPGFCKTSGARGMHIYVPLRPTFSYGQVKDFARLIYSVIMLRHPDLTSLERNPAKRIGRVYLDYPQNRFGATMVVPYSLRPKEKAPVSTPLEWSEVTRELNPLDFNIHTIRKRLINRGDCWKDLFKQRADLAKSLALLEKLIKK